tara:strand:+ start:236 stop:484 length:249 start_codon:yes stop_codon:yes gene_type:complete
MVEKNVCQNPTCYAKRNKDQWNKKANAFQSRKAYFKRGHNHYKIFEYFCTTSCANTWLEDNLENIIERNHIPRKIIEKIIGS